MPTDFATNAKVKKVERLCPFFAKFVANIFTKLPKTFAVISVVVKDNFVTVAAPSFLIRILKETW